MLWRAEILIMVSYVIFLVGRLLYQDAYSEAAEKLVIAVTGILILSAVFLGIMDIVAFIKS